MRLLLWITLAWLLPGCLSIEPRQQAPNKLFWTQWVLIELQGESLPGTVQSSMQLGSSGQVTGNGGMHRFLAQVDLEPDGTLSFTRPRCVQQIGPDWGWAQQERFLTSLEHSARWWFYGPYLVIADAWNRPHLVFLPAG
ncbi:MAG: META domain-containing protein [Planctomycetota bacterium]|jgi:heat shock protein HslJ